MRKIIGSILISLIIMFGIQISSNAWTNKVNLVIDGIENQISVDDVPVNVNNDVLVPLRSFAEGMGLSVNWNYETMTVSFDEYLFIQLDNNIARFNDGSTISMENTMRIINDRIMMPFRFVIEQFGYECIINEDANTITLTREQVEGTEVSGIISQDTTWTDEGSPYIVKGNILIDEGAKLTIEPGVKVLFIGDYYIQVRGNIYAVGTEENRIYFEGLYNTSWNGIDMHSEDNHLIYCQIAGNRYASEVRLKSNSSLINCNIFRAQQVVISGDNGSILNNNLIDCSYGIWINGNLNVVRNNIISGGYRGIGVSYGSDVNISFCKVTNSGSGFSISGKAAINDCIIDNNDNGFSLSSEASVKVERCSITNSKIGLNIDNSYSLIFEHCNFDNNELNVKNKSVKNYELYNNYWGTDSKPNISAKIFDFYDDFNYGKVIYEPFLTKPFNDGYTIASRNSGIFTQPIEIALSAIGEGFEIYYTLNGEDPTINGTPYTMPINLKTNTILKAVTKKEGVWGEIQQYDYVFNITPPEREYRINSITLADIDGTIISSIPGNTDFYVRVNVKKNVINNNERLIIALYDENSKLIKMYTDETFLKVNLLKGESGTYVQLVSQYDNRISKIKAFVWNGYHNLLPCSYMKQL